jgi:DNA-binding MarR family transcriptional regulator
MSRALSKDVAKLEAALAALKQVLSSHRYWESLTDKAGIEIDRLTLNLLRALQLHQPCRLQDLSGLLAIEAPTTSRKIQQLEDDKLVLRSADSKDRRVSWFKMTKRGEAVLKKIMNIKHDELQNVIKSWSADERQQLANLLQKLADDTLEHYKIN